MKDLIISNRQLPTVKEGILRGLEVASGAKSSATYYHKKGDMQAAVRNSVLNLYKISKELPLLLACQRGATGFFIQEALLNELKQTERGGACNIVNPTDWYDEKLGNILIVRALHNLDVDSGITYVLRLFAQYKDNKINNARAKKLVSRFVWTHPNLDFISVKYRNKLKSILMHVYGVKSSTALALVCKDFVESGIFRNEKSRKLAHDSIGKFTDDFERAARAYLFIFGRGKKDYFTDVEKYKVTNQYFKAKTDIFSVDSVPEEVIVGLIGNKNHPQYQELWSNKTKRQDTLKQVRERNKVTSANQQVRQTKKNESLGVQKEVKMEQVTDFLALYKTGYENGFTPEINMAIDQLAEKKKFRNFAYQNVGIILDKSASMLGHKAESKNTPRAVADFTAKVLKKSCASAKIIETSGQNSDLASAYINLMEQGSYDAVFILSDGYENSYDGLLNEVVGAFREMTGDATPIYHASPVVGAETNAKVRSMGNQISTMAVSKPEAISVQISGKLLEQDTKKWLENQFKMLAETPSSRKEKSNV